MLVALVVLVVFVVVGIGVLAMRNRTERGIESGISSFRRELDALAPRGEPKAGPAARPGQTSDRDDSDDSDDSGDDEEEDADPPVRTVQIGDKPPPRKLSASPPDSPPTNAQPPSADGEAGAADGEAAATDEGHADGS